MKFCLLVGIVVFSLGCKKTPASPNNDGSTSGADAAGTTTGADYVSVRVPAPWSSLVTVPVEVEVTARAKTEDIQAAFSIRTYPQRSLVPVTFKWSEIDSGRNVVISWPSGTTGDLILSLQPTSALNIAPVLMGFSLISNPSVSSIQVAPKDGEPTYWNTALIGFSEAVVTSSITSTSVQVLHDSKPIAGTFAGPGAATASAVSFNFAEQIPASEKLTFVVTKELTPVSGKPFNPQAWDSVTRNAADNFEVVIDPATQTSDCGAGCYSWRPSIAPK